jgi:hypothetical protein
MKVNGAILIFFMVFCGAPYCASFDYVIDIESEKPKVCIKNGWCQETELSVNKDDINSKVNSLLTRRWFCRKLANISEVGGNAFFHCGTGLFILSGASVGLYPSLTNYFFLASTVCNALNLMLIGVAAYSSIKVEEIQLELNTLVKNVGFHVTTLIPEITNDRVSNSR